MSQTSRNRVPITVRVCLGIISFRNDFFSEKRKRERERERAKTKILRQISSFSEKQEAFNTQKKKKKSGSFLSVRKEMREDEQARFLQWQADGPSNGLQWIHQEDSFIGRHIEVIIAVFFLLLDVIAATLSCFEARSRVFTLALFGLSSMVVVISVISYSVRKYCQAIGRQGNDASGNRVIKELEVVFSVAQWAISLYNLLMVFRYRKKNYNKIEWMVVIAFGLYVLCYAIYRSTEREMDNSVEKTRDDVEMANERDNNASDQVNVLSNPNIEGDSTSLLPNDSLHLTQITTIGGSTDANSPPVTSIDGPTPISPMPNAEHKRVVGQAVVNSHAAHPLTTDSRSLSSASRHSAHPVTTDSSSSSFTQRQVAQPPTTDSRSSTSSEDTANPLITYHGSSSSTPRHTTHPLTSASRSSSSTSRDAKHLLKIDSKSSSSSEDTANPLTAYSRSSSSASRHTAHPLTSDSKSSSFAPSTIKEEGAGYISSDHVASMHYDPANKNTQETTAFRRHIKSWAVKVVLKERKERSIGDILNQLNAISSDLQRGKLTVEENFVELPILERRLLEVGINLVDQLSEWNAAALPQIDPRSSITIEQCDFMILATTNLLQDDSFPFTVFMRLPSLNTKKWVLKMKIHCETCRDALEFLKLNDSEVVSEPRESDMLVFSGNTNLLKLLNKLVPIGCGRRISNVSSFDDKTRVGKNEKVA